MRSTRTAKTALTLFSVIGIAVALGGGGGAAADTAHPLHDGPTFVAVTDQASDQILVLDPTVSDWNATNDSAALKWAWQPTAANGFSDAMPSWALPSSARLRHSEQQDSDVLVTTASYGFVGVASYPSGQRVWSTDVGTAPNAHSAELLPNGNIAVAASTPGWVRIYAASQGPDAQNFVQYDLAAAHAVLWDPEDEVLWAVGLNDIVALKIGGSADSPTISVVRDTLLPQGGGHALEPVYGNKDRLWVATGSYVFQYLKETDTWSTSYPGARSLDRRGVKSVGNDPVTGQVLETLPSNLANPGSCATSWCTPTVDFFLPQMTRTRAGAQFYRAIWWVSAYA
jgi:hypothetical protein